MADVLNRDEKEAELAKAIAKEFTRARQELMTMFPELEKWMTDVDPTFWDTHTANLQSTIAPLLSKDFIAQAETMMGEFDFLGVEWGLVNQAAADWAGQYAFELVSNLTETSRTTLQKLIPQFFEQQMTQGQLRDALSGTFGVIRAEMIARTEVTRAASEGELALSRELAANGIVLRHVWHTRNDEIVCPLCGPLNGQEIMDNSYPPRHPRCRCWWGQEIRKEQ